MKIVNPPKNYSLILSKICLGFSISSTDPTNFPFLLGYRKSLFSFINPFFVQSSLKIGLSFFESFLKNKYNVLFIINLKDPILLAKFRKICKSKNFSLLRDSEFSSGFLTNRRISNLLVVTLFLDSRKTQLIQKESLLTNVPLISFNELSSNKFASSVSILGAYSSSISKNLILSLLSVCLHHYPNNYKNNAT